MSRTQRHSGADQRRETIATLYLQGVYQSVIARQLGVTQQQISYDLKALRRQWQASALRNFDAAKSLEIAKIDEIERVAWEAWARSCQPREVTVQEAIEGERRTNKAVLRKEQQVGDPRFLERIQKCIEQ